MATVSGCDWIVSPNLHDKRLREKEIRGRIVNYFRDVWYFLSGDDTIDSFDEQCAELLTRMMRFDKQYEYYPAHHEWITLLKSHHKMLLEGRIKGDMMNYFIRVYVTVAANEWHDIRRVTRTTWSVSRKHTARSILNDRRAR